VNNDLRKYFNEKGEYIPETWWFDTVKMEKRNVRENKYCCPHCPHTFSFQDGEVEVGKIKTVIKRAGSEKERKVRSREKERK
jgi:transposase-like protein